jgi:hypothetical protein
VAIEPAGQDPKCVDRAPQARTVTLCLQHKSSLLWIRLLLVFGNDKHMERYTHAHRRWSQRVSAGGIRAFGPVKTPLPKGKTL